MNRPDAVGYEIVAHYNREDVVYVQSVIGLATYDGAVFQIITRETQKR